MIPGLALFEGTKHQYPIYDAIAMGVQVMVFTYLLGRTDARRPQCHRDVVGLGVEDQLQSALLSVVAVIVIGNVLYGAVFAPHLARSWGARSRGPDGAAVPRRAEPAQMMFARARKAISGDALTSHRGLLRPVRPRNRRRSRIRRGLGCAHEAPLYCNEKYDFYALSRYDDVAPALPDWQTYRSGRGTTAEILFSGIEVPPGILLFEDPPIHDLHRRLLSRVFTPRRMLAVEDLVREFCSRALDPLRGRGRVRLRRRVRREMPMRTIGYLLGIPEEAQEHIRDITDKSIRVDGGGRATSARRSSGVDRVFAEYIEWRATHPSDDLMTELLNAEVEEPDGRGAGSNARGPRLHRHDRRCRQRNHGPAHRIHGAAARRASRSTTRTRRRSIPDPGRGRGDPAVRAALARAGALCRPRRRTATGRP